MTYGAPFHSLAELETRARSVLDEDIWSYLAGGTAGGEAGRENIEAWARVKFSPRILRGVEKVDRTVTMFGDRLSSPFMIAPTGRATRFHPEGEAALIAGASAGGGAALLPSSILHGIGALRAANPEAVLWQQVYLTCDREFLTDRLREAREAKVSVIVVTVDLAPGGAGANNALSPPPKARWEPDARRAPPPMYTAASTDDLEWICSEAGMPVFVKGVLRADDASRCLEVGAHGVIVSNHGGNQLADAVTTADALVAVVDACGETAPVLVDGGIRSGASAAKALALGAKAVMIGRPAAWGLATAGAEGVTSVITLLDTELERTMRLCGASSLAAMTRDILAT